MYISYGYMIHVCMYIFYYMIPVLIILFRLCMYDRMMVICTLYLIIHTVCTCLRIYDIYAVAVVLIYVLSVVMCTKAPSTYV
jgi:hypothetical protein